MRSIHITLLLSACLTLMIQSNISAQKKFLGVPTIEYFYADDYGAHMANAKIIQDQRGLICVANEQGFLEYDGSNWKQHFSNNGEKGIASMYADPSGRLYAINLGIGYYFPDVKGSYEYHSLDHLTPGEQPSFGVGKIMPYKSGFVFTNIGSLYLYDLDTIEIINNQIPYAFFSHVCNGELYTSPNGKGLSIFNGEDWDLIPGGSILADMFITSLLSMSNGSMLAVTESNGLFLIENNSIVPFAVTMQENFTQEMIQSAALLSNNLLAIGTRSNGLYILNQNGNIVYHLNGDNGLNTSIIFDIFQDSVGNIWLAKENGLVRIDWNSAFSFIDEQLGLPGVGLCALAFDKQIYFGTSTGLYRAEKKWPLENITHIKNVQGPVNNIQNINGDILVSSDYTVFQKICDAFEPISPPFDYKHYALKETRNENVLILGSVLGMYRLERTNGKWAVTKKYDDFYEWTKYLEFDENDRLWTTSSTKGVFSFTFSEDYQSIKSKSIYDKTKGLPSNFASKVFKVDNALVFSTIYHGIYEYDSLRDEFYSSPVWNRRFDIGEHIFDISEDAFGNIYYCDMDQPGSLKKNIRGNYDKESSMFDGIQSHIEGRLAILDNQNILFSYPEGFIHYNRNTPQINNYMPDLLIRHVKLSQSDSILFGGNFLSEGRIVKEQMEDNVPTLSYKDNSLIIGFSAIQYNRNDMTYRYQLEGYDSEWSSWTSKTEISYTNLDIGKYIFKVQTKNVNEQLSPIQTYKFSITPPWYNTYLFYAICAICLIGFTSIIIFKYRKKIKKEIGSLKKKNLQIEILHKKKQLAAKTMHLVDKTEFVNAVKGKLTEALAHKNEVEIHRIIKRVIRQIDQNKSEDNNWEDFEHHFDEVHHGFLKKMRTNYPAITPQEIKLSAYLRMNMTTKEIANLLKVSVRAVEMARFRLRRRLNLDKEEKLVSFMMNF